MKKILQFVIIATTLFTTMVNGQEVRKDYDITKDKVLYTVGYGHLDTQWMWDVRHSINTCLKNTLEENFYLFGKYPGYVYNFTGSRRYRMMKEYYPEHYRRLKEYIAEGKWHLSGSSVDEGEVNISSPEALLRQVLYGNRFFKQEFGKTSADYMLPDCFGFVATTPSVLAHAGLLGFSTQKLTWRLSGELPFNVGVWNGLDGKGVIAALNAGDYTAKCEERLDRSDYWNGRIEDNFKKYGLSFDYRYYGVGDQGGAVRENDARNATGSVNNIDSKFKVVLASSDQMFRDVTPEIRRKMPVFTGDLLLIEHSAGSMTSQSFMKRVNRKSENLAQSAESASVMADIESGIPYPHTKLNNAWELLLGNTMHDILPGTSIPKAYELAWNDAFIAANGFETALRYSLSQISGKLDTKVDGIPLVVYNPVATDREDVVEAELPLGSSVVALEVTGPDGRTIPAQIIGRNGDNIRFLFIAKVPALGLSVYNIKRSASEQNNNSLQVSSSSLENDYYRVTIASNGNIESIYDKKLKRELLARPAELEFQYEKPKEWPSWNMDWEDRSRGPVAYLNQNASMRIVEFGPVRIAVEVSRSGRNSNIRQLISLSAGDAGKRIEISNILDWQTRESSLKASFPLTVSNQEATYNLGVGAIKRTNNRPDQFEVPHKNWINLTDKSGSNGVSILEDCKYGSDKPSDNTLRLTLMYTPGVRNDFRYQGMQDFGIHKFKYGIYSHKGDWKESETHWQAEFLNKPLVAFKAPAHDGEAGKTYSVLSISNKRIGLMALKKAEDSEYIIVRINETTGESQSDVRLTFHNQIEDAFEVNGQEERIGDAAFKGNILTTDIGYNTIKSFAVRLRTSAQNQVRQQPLALAYNEDQFTTDNNRDDATKFPGLFSYPAELIPDVIESGGIRFEMGTREDTKNNVVRCEGQQIALPKGNFNKVYLIAAGQDEINGAEFLVGDSKQKLNIARWTGTIGQHYLLRFRNNDSELSEILTPFLRKDAIAWFSSHRHYGYPSGNQAYEYCYMFCYSLDIPEGATSVTLPDNSKIKIFAMTASFNNGDDILLASDLFENFDNAESVKVR